MIALVALVGAHVTVAGWVLRVPLILGHDESVYAVLARHWLSDTAATGVAPHRAPLLPVLGMPVLASGGGELGLRSWGIVAGVVAIIAVWWIGRRMGGAVTGLLAASVFIFSPTVLEASTAYLTDLPAAAVLLLLTGLLWSQFAEREAPTWALYLVAPLAWAAYELRYGSALPVLLLFAVTWLLFRDAVRSHARRVLATLVLLAILLLPHLVNSTTDLGHPIARLLYTTDIAGREYIGEGLVDYARGFPQDLAGPATAALMAVGLVGGLVAAVARRRRPEGWSAPNRTGPESNRARVFAFLLLPALAHVVLIGITSHGEPRFVFFAVALISVAGAVVVRDVLALVLRRSAALVWSALVVAGMLIAAEAALVARYESRARDGSAERYAVLEQSADAIIDRAGEDCSVLTTYTPQITWMTECESYHFGSPPVTGRERFLSGDGWMVLFEEGKRQPEGEVLEHYLAIGEPVITWDPPHSGLFGSGVLYRMEGADG